MLDLNLGISPLSIDNRPKDNEGHLQFQSGPCYANDMSTMVTIKLWLYCTPTTLFWTFTYKLMISL